MHPQHPHRHANQSLKLVFTTRRAARVRVEAGKAGVQLGRECEPIPECGREHEERKCERRTSGVGVAKKTGLNNCAILSRAYMTD